MSALNLKWTEYGPKYWSGFTEKNHLGYAYGVQPQKASNTMTFLFLQNVNYFDLFSYLDQYPTKYFKTNDEYYWDVTIGAGRNIPLVECRINGTAITASDKVGIGKSTFELVFAEDYFFEGDVIWADHYEYQVRLISRRQEGTNVVFEARYINSDNTGASYIPYAQLVPGKRFSRGWGGVESTMSDRGVGINFESPFRMRNYFTQLRMEHTTPGDMIPRPLGVEWIDPQTKKKIIMWQDLVEWKFEQEFRRQRANALYYSMLNVDQYGKSTEKGKSGFELIQGAGLLQQIEASGVEYYPTETFDIDWLTQILLGLSVNRITEDKRQFVLRTGEYGMVQFSKALQDYASLYTPLNDSTRVVLKGNTLQYRGQFLEFMGPNGIKVVLEHDFEKDNPITNKIPHPNGGLASSYQYDILNMGTINGEPNIQKVAQTGQEDIRGYIPGLRNPFNPNGNNTIMATSKDGWTENRMWIGGIMVKDPTSCKVLKPQILSLT